MAKNRELSQVGSLVTVYDSSAQVGIADANGDRVRTFGGIFAPNNDNTTETVSAVHLDSPATTSAITYNIKGLTSNSSYPTYINRARNRSQSSASFPKLRSTLTLTEHSA